MAVKPYELNKHLIKVNPKLVSKAAHYFDEIYLKNGLYEDIVNKTKSIAETADPEESLDLLIEGLVLATPYNKTRFVESINPKQNIREQINNYLENELFNNHNEISKKLQKIDYQNKSGNTIVRIEKSPDKIKEAIHNTKSCIINFDLEKIKRFVRDPSTQYLTIEQEGKNEGYARIVLYHNKDKQYPLIAVDKIILRNPTYEAINSTLNSLTDISDEVGTLLIDRRLTNDYIKDKNGRIKVFDKPGPFYKTGHLPVTTSEYGIKYDGEDSYAIKKHNQNK